MQALALAVVLVAAALETPALASGASAARDVLLGAMAAAMLAAVIAG